jgi:hypothetical protein
VPLTEANATAFFRPSATSAREAAAERALVAANNGEQPCVHFDCHSVIFAWLREKEIRR